jgi:hypothetical protein
MATSCEILHSVTYNAYHLSNTIQVQRISTSLEYAYIVYAIEINSPDWVHERVENFRKEL